MRCISGNVVLLCVVWSSRLSHRRDRAFGRPMVVHGHRARLSKGLRQTGHGSRGAIRSSCAKSEATSISYIAYRPKPAAGFRELRRQYAASHLPQLPSPAAAGLEAAASSTVRAAGTGPLPRKAANFTAKKLLAAQRPGRPDPCNARAHGRSCTCSFGQLARVCKNCRQVSWKSVAAETCQWNR